ncbi:hypothetical protein GGTG_04603 [Gaeumannomyces tritici R3-111a-1]|uniref:Uncharacterized protein n=1 Tax=Gaeumannomyces tritici (strain R3-111a-1) TaxID=644352 RepID=J3NTK3_GAET3|nr:hypothetical protein GGTG_04603 [Gaeumannomyces tritici R3-111a-1]EJT79518.1 hypothetical protein GGTG_04603 [Gaeumannomyces tritici R3-111a-1]
MAHGCSAHISSVRSAQLLLLARLLGQHQTAVRESDWRVKTQALACLSLLSTLACLGSVTFHGQWDSKESASLKGYGTRGVFGFPLRASMWDRNISRPGSRNEEILQGRHRRFNARIFEGTVGNRESERTKTRGRKRKEEKIRPDLERRQNGMADMGSPVSRSRQPHRPGVGWIYGRFWREVDSKIYEGSLLNLFLFCYLRRDTFGDGGLVVNTRLVLGQLARAFYTKPVKASCTRYCLAAGAMAATYVVMWDIVPFVGFQVRTPHQGHPKLLYTNMSTPTARLGDAPDPALACAGNNNVK